MIYLEDTIEGRITGAINGFIGLQGVLSVVSSKDTRREQRIPATDTLLVRH